MSQTPPHDWIHLRNIRTECILGIYPAERHTPREIRMDISLRCDTRRAAQTGQLADTINYERIESDAIAIAVESRCELIETLAEKIAAACLAHPGVQAVRVTIDKPAALPHTQSVAVEIVREKAKEPRP